MPVLAQQGLAAGRAGRVESDIGQKVVDELAVDDMGVDIYFHLVGSERI